MQDADFYDQLALYFRAYSRKRRAYLNGIDDLVVPNLKGASLLDVGAGDGVRAMRLARRAGLRRLVLVEPNLSMARRCESLGAEVLPVRAEELSLPPGSFDNITCLWNVLGHIETRADRIRALRNMARLLAPGATLHLDLQNRFNLRAYGWRKVAINMARDLKHPRGENGGRRFDIDLGSRRISARGYLFSPAEASRMIEAAGLRVVRRLSVDYRTGQLRRTWLEGQLFYELAPVRPC
jgi:ubiquinone/menaquinone biosynthesis C-methylase UbiE